MTDNLIDLTSARAEPPVAFSVASRVTGPGERQPAAENRWAPAPVPATAARIPADSPPAADDLASIATVTEPVIATRGVRGVLGRFGIRLAPGAAEQALTQSAERLRRDEETIRQTTWTRAVSVLVANRKGGVGKTPVSLLLGGTLASVRGGSVCVVEVSDDPGALTFRAEGSPALGLGELVRDVATVTSAGQLAGYTAPQTSFASVIGSVRERDRLGRDDVIAVAAVIDEYYGIRVMDSGNQSSSDAFDGAVETADALVIPVLNAGESVFEALALLERLRSRGGRAAALAGRAVILRLTDGRPEHPQVLERINRIIEGAGAAQVFAVPYDAHIAERGQLTLASLDPATYRVFAAAAASIVRSIPATD
ncbi:MinD/ParA family protein [Lacisediminihabitans sp.]|uniref:MinD/ParA family ATP-binding protein n=1 Tax=Lacisediminihabitans sp. TaxID=2787631 RepID=UPI00374D04AB